MSKKIPDLAIAPSSSANLLWLEVAREISTGVWNGISERIQVATLITLLADAGAAINLNLIQQLNPTGAAYSATATYTLYDYLDVPYQGRHYAYIGTSPSTGNAPPDPAYWVLISTDGISAIATVAGTPPNTPAIGSSATYSVDSSAGHGINQYAAIVGMSGVFLVSAIASSTAIALQNVSAPVGATVPAGAKIVPAGKPGAAGAAGAVGAVGAVGPIGPKGDKGDPGVPGSGGGGASGLQYQYNAVAGSGVISAASLSTATSLTINATDAQGKTAADVLARLKAGAIFEVRKDATNWVRYSAAADYASETVAVAVAAFLGAIASGDTVFLSIASDAPSFAGKLIASTLIAYGDSVTVGTGASTTAQGYAVLVSQAVGWALTNNAAGSTGITDASDLILAAAPSDTTQFILAFGLNDLSYHQSSSNGQSIFVDALAASIAWLGIRAGERSKGQSTNIAYAGTWTNSANYGGGIAKAGVATATAIFNFNGSALLIGYSRLATATATFTVSIDGGAATTVAGVNAAASRAGRNFSPCLHTISGLSDTDHTVVITISTGTLELIYLAGIGSETFAFGAPTVLVGNIIKMLPASFSTPAAPPNIDALVGIWNDLIKTKINALSALGLGVKYVNSNSQFKAIDFAADQQHPNNAGHITIANAFLSKILSIPDLKYSGIAKILPAAAAAPTMSSFSPELGDAGQSVVITGTEFSSATAVLFGVIPATSFIVNSSTQITAVIPANVIAAPLSVQNALGSGSSAAKFYRAVPSVSTPVVDMKGIYGSEMAAVPPTDYLGGKTITVTGTPPTLNTTQFDVSPSLNFAAGVIHSTLDAQDLLSVDFEFRAWIRPTKLTSDHEVFVIRESITPGTIERECALEISSLGAIRFVLQKASVINFDFYSPAGIIAVNSAYRVVASVRGTTATVRVNGSVVSTAAVVGARSQMHTRLLVGAMYDGGGGDRFFVGAIDSVLLLKS